MTIFGSFHFSDTLLRTCSKAIAIMVVRFRPTAPVYHAAASIAEVLQKLEQGNRSSLFADADSIKLGLMNPTISQSVHFPEMQKEIKHNWEWRKHVSKWVSDKIHGE